MRMTGWMYVIPFIGAFVLTLVALSLLVIVFRKIQEKGLIPIHERHTPVAGIARISGIAFVAVFLLALCFNSNLILTSEWWGMLISIVVLLVFGIWDDIVEISWKIQLFAQCLAASVAFFFGIRIISFYNPFGGMVFFGDGFLSICISFALSVLWIVMIMNAINWSDGIDGLSGGLVSFGFFTIFILSLRPEVYQPPVAILSLILLGISLGFLTLNFYPAKVFAGTSGIWFFGFSLAVLSIFSGTKIATSLLVLILPILDAIWVVFDRYRSGVSIFRPDHRHFHHRLQSFGWSQRQVTLFSYGVTAMVMFVTLNIHGVNKLLFFFLLSVVILELFFLNPKKA